MSVFGKGMKRIGKIVDVDMDLQGRVVKALVVKVDGKEAKQIWKGIISLRSPKISVPTELISTAKDAIQLQYGLDELNDHVKKV
jgi:sporulation protein YlmC with PRC-barrel domain